MVCECFPKSPWALAARAKTTTMSARQTNERTAARRTLRQRDPPGCVWRRCFLRAGCDIAALLSFWNQVALLHVCVAASGSRHDVAVLVDGRISVVSGVV